MVTSYVERIAAHGEDHPHRVALVDDDGELGYRELLDEVDRSARGLAARGVGPGDVVAVWLPNGRAWVRTFLAVSTLGATTLCVNTSFGAHELATLARRARPTAVVLAPHIRGRDLVGIVADADPEALATVGTWVVEGVGTGRDDPAVGRLQSLTGRSVLTATELAAAFGDGAAVSGRWASGAPAVIFTSSGTTGDPKLVVHTVASLSGHVAAVAEAYGMGRPDARVLAPMPFCGVMGLETMLSGLVAGTTVATMGGFDGRRAAELVARHGMTVLACSDEALRRIVDSAGDGELSSLRDVALAVFGGDPAPLLARARELGFRAFQTYGSSEVHALLCFPPAGTPEAELAVGGGRPVLPDYRARVRVEGRTLAHGDRGSLEIQSPHLFAGYLDGSGGLQRALSADGWFSTGDLGATFDGGFAYLARESDALRLGGYLVEPREIECFLEDLPGVGSAQVVGADDGRRTVAVAFLLAAPADGTASPDEATVIEYCRARLARFKVPAAVEWVDAFPVTEGPNGVKIRRTELRERAGSVLAARGVRVPESA